MNQYLDTVYFTYPWLFNLDGLCKKKIVNRTSFYNRPTLGSGLRNPCAFSLPAVLAFSIYGKVYPGSCHLGIDCARNT